MSRTVPKQHAPSRRGARAPSPIGPDPALEALLGRGCLVTLSFKFLDLEHETFNCGKADREWFLSFLGHLHEMSCRTWTQVSNERHFRAHPIDPYSLKLTKLGSLEIEQIGRDNWWQVGLGKTRGRVHGCLIQTTYYVVVLDPEHLLYPQK